MIVKVVLRGHSLETTGEHPLLLVLLLKVSYLVGGFRLEDLDCEFLVAFMDLRLLPQVCSDQGLPIVPQPSHFFLYANEQILATLCVDLMRVQDATNQRHVLPTHFRFQF